MWSLAEAPAKEHCLDQELQDQQHVPESMRILFWNIISECEGGGHTLKAYSHKRAQNDAFSRSYPSD